MRSARRKTREQAACNCLTISAMSALLARRRVPTMCSNAVACLIVMTWWWVTDLTSCDEKKYTDGCTSGEHDNREREVVA